MSQQTLEGQVAIVTGAGGGIGEAIAHTLALHGAAAVVADRDGALAGSVAQAITDGGGRAIGVAADVTSSAEVAKLFTAARGFGGSVDILVNNVGGYGVIRPSWEIEEAEWDAVMALNVKSTFLCSKAAIPNMIERRRGRIINVSSLVGRVGGLISAAHYAAGKAAVRGFTWQLAAELGPHGITVNAVAPGIVTTERLKRVRGEDGIADLSAKIPLRRAGEPMDIADAVLFLVGDGAKYVTGATLDVNGGSAML